MASKKKSSKCGAVHDLQKKLVCDLAKGHDGHHSGEAYLHGAKKKTRHKW